MTKQTGKKQKPDPPTLIGGYVHHLRFLTKLTAIMRSDGALA
jgi:hypothetical protein